MNEANLQDENSILRGLVAAQSTPCVYCGLTEMAKCASGFPGCAQADDLICGEDAAFKAVVAERNALRARVAKLEERLEITHCWRHNPDGSVTKEEIPSDQRDSFPDGIYCRDETIKQLESMLIEEKRKRI